jgi:hypothetical protein
VLLARSLARSLSVVHAPPGVDACRAVGRLLSPPQPFKTEERKVLIGAREPMTKEHMVLEMCLLRL